MSWQPVYICMPLSSFPPKTGQSVPFMLGLAFNNQKTILASMVASTVKMVTVHKHSILFRT